jgi:hypothetical protein
VRVLPIVSRTFAAFMDPRAVVGRTNAHIVRLSQPRAGISLRRRATPPLASVGARHRARPPERARRTDAQQPIRRSSGHAFQALAGRAPDRRSIVGRLLDRLVARHRLEIVVAKLQPIVLPT